MRWITTPRTSGPQTWDRGQGPLRRAGADLYEKACFASPVGGSSVVPIHFEVTSTWRAPAINEVLVEGQRRCCSHTERQERARKPRRCSCKPTPCPHQA
jgi:hypothetical protein